MASKLSKNGAHALNSWGPLEVAGFADSVYDGGEPVSDASSAPSAALQISGLHKSFGEREVLKDLSLSVPEALLSR